VDFVGEGPVESLGLHVYPEGQSDATVYEDDGESLEYLKGAVATTEIRCEAGSEGMTLTIGPRQGAYHGMPANRTYEVVIHAARPRALTVNGARVEWTYDPQAGVVRATAREDPSRKTPLVIRCER
jgi:hypothetical protein